MKLYSENENYKLYSGSMLDMLEVIESNTIDSIVTDPPYGLTSITKRFGKENSAECQYGKDGSFQRLSKGFMGKEWDGSGIEYNIDTWKKCYEVLKPGGYLLAFGGSRTFHRIACAIEDAGFEIRDTIMWIYGSGFPKSQNISKILDKKFGEERPIIGYTKNAGIAKNAKPDSTGSHIWSGNIRSDKPITDLAKQWQGWGTSLKPSFEPIIVARKPFKGSLVNNIIKNGVGGINIDECRVGNEELRNSYAGNKNSGFTSGDERNDKGKGMFSGIKKGETVVNGRFPANTILTYDETDFEEVCGGFPQNQKPAGNKKAVNYDNKDYDNSSYKINYTHNPKIAGDNGGSASRYFYCAKASKKDRDEGLDVEMEEYMLKEDTSKEMEQLILNSLTS